MGKTNNSTERFTRKSEKNDVKKNKQKYINNKKQQNKNMLAYKYEKRWNH